MKLTNLEQMIICAVSARPQEWLNCSGVYLSEVLALQLKGAIYSRVDNNQLQVKYRQMQELIQC